MRVSAEVGLHHQRPPRPLLAARGPAEEVDTHQCPLQAPGDQEMQHLRAAVAAAG